MPDEWFTFTLRDDWEAAGFSPDNIAVNIAGVRMWWGWVTTVGLVLIGLVLYWFYCIGEFIRK